MSDGRMPERIWLGYMPDAGEVVWCQDKEVFDEQDVFDNLERKTPTEYIKRKSYDQLRELIQRRLEQRSGDCLDYWIHDARAALAAEGSGE